MLKRVRDKAKKLLSLPGKLLKWGVRSSREKATIVFTSSILGFIVFITVLCIFPTFIFSVMWLVAASAILYMIWHMLEDALR